MKTHGKLDKIEKAMRPKLPVLVVTQADRPGASPVAQWKLNTYDWSDITREEAEGYIAAGVPWKIESIVILWGEAQKIHPDWPGRTDPWYAGPLWVIADPDWDWRSDDATVTENYDRAGLAFAMVVHDPPVEEDVVGPRLVFSEWITVDAETGEPADWSDRAGVLLDKRTGAVQ